LPAPQPGNNPNENNTLEELVDTAAVRSPFDVTLVGAELPVLMPAQLEYYAADPYAVTAVFNTGDRPIRWVFARDLLDEGLVHDVGDGDIQIVPSRDPLGVHVLQLRLSSPDGVAVLEASADVILEFLGRSYALVPPGTESAFVDMDDTITRLLTD
jgi:hypothetical protein